MSRVVTLGALVGLSLCLEGCRKDHSDPTTGVTTGGSASSVASVGRPPRPIGVETVPIAGDLPAFVFRGTPVAGRPMVFLSGVCTHPVGYVQSFQGTAAAHGDVVTIQGDVSCGGNGALRQWSADLDAMDRRIEAALRASGLAVEAPLGVTVIGYSQGAERAERLVARWPARYSSAVFIASPIVPSPRDLAKASAVVLMAGTLESQANMRSAVGPLTRAGIPATFIELPGARHGQLGPEPSGPMGRALDFLDENDTLRDPRRGGKMKSPDASPVTTGASAPMNPP